MSANLRSLLTGEPGDLVPGPGGDLLVAFMVGDLRVMGLEVELDSQPDDPSHVGVRGPKSHALRKRLANMASWVVAPAPL